MSTSEWQSWRCGVVLSEVFSWLSGRELARAGAVCRAWHDAASDPTLWRRLLLYERLVEPAAHKRLCSLRSDTDTISWRQEYVDASAGWELLARHTPAGGALLLHAALAPSQDVLALGADDASLTVWRHIKGSWREVWRTELRPRGWAAVARVEWARHTPRLLLAGPRTLIDDWELMVVHLDEDYTGGTIASRVRCSAGAAGCWADVNGDTFLSLELQLVGLGLACTTVRLNAATQETQSEYAGVTSALLRIFNEDRAHITHILVATLEEGRRVLVGGTSQRLATWPVAAPRPLPVLVGEPGELAERVRRHRARMAEPEQEPPEPDEDTIRALCAPPDREWRLSAPLVGLAIDDSARWLWAACSDGSVTRVCVRSMKPLLCVRAPLYLPLPPAHYVHPAVTHLYVASPEGGYSPRVWIWSLRSGATAQCGGERPRWAKSMCKNCGIEDVQSKIRKRDDVWRDEDNSENYDVVGDDVNDENNGIWRDDVNDENNGIWPDDVNGENDDNVDHKDESYNVHEDEANSSNATDSEHANNAGTSEVGDNRDKSDIEHDGMSDNVIHRRNSGKSAENGNDVNGASVSRADDASESEPNTANKSEIDDASCSVGRDASDNRVEDASSSDDNALFINWLNDVVWHELEAVSGIDPNSESTVNGTSDTGRGACASNCNGCGGRVSGSEKRVDYHAGAAVCTLLPRNDPSALLVLAADTLYIWRRRATRQSSPNLFYE